MDKLNVVSATDLKSFEVTAMFPGGAIEVHDKGDDSYVMMDINDLLADKKALDDIVITFNTSSTGHEEMEDVWHRVQAVRRNDLHED